MGLVVKAWRYYREHGLRDFAHRIHRRRKFFVYVKDLPAPPPVPEDPEVCFRLAGPEDVDWLAGQLTHWGSGAREALGEMLRAGDRAVIGVRRCGRGGLTYISWLSSRDPLLVALRGVSPEPCQTCSRGIWVPPAYRRRGMARRGLAFAESVAARSGAKRIWAFAIEWNSPSKRLHERLGYRRYGLLRIGRRWGRRFAEFQPTGRRRWRPLTPPEPGPAGWDERAEQAEQAPSGGR